MTGTTGSLVLRPWMHLASRVASPVSGVLTVLIPKCPLCSLALLQLLGINSAFAAGLVGPIFLAMAALPALFLAFQAFHLRAWPAFGMYLLGVGLLLLDRLYWNSVYASLFGLLLLVLAAVWIARCRARNNSCSARCLRGEKLHGCS
jgi:hypothetical protein